PPPSLSTLPLHDALPISAAYAAPPILRKHRQFDEDETVIEPPGGFGRQFRLDTVVPPLPGAGSVSVGHRDCAAGAVAGQQAGERSEEHTSELQSRENLVC